MLAKFLVKDKHLQMTRYVYVLFIFSFLGQSELTAQDDGSIAIKNGSFEDSPRQGGDNVLSLRGWFDCGRVDFPDQTPPDVHPKEFWGNTAPPAHGKTYLGMVVREDETWESVAQRLDSAMVVGQCYSLSIELCRSDKYLSATSLSRDVKKSFTRPIVLRVWGGSGYCNQRQLLSESLPIDHTDWKTYEFNFEAMFPNRYITVEAFYNTPTLHPYNGHLLIDNLSDINIIPCPEQEMLAVAYPQINKAEVSIPAHKRKRKKKKLKPKAKKEKVIASASVPSTPVTKPVRKKTIKTKILKDLNKKTLKEGQTINIQKLYFAADTSSIDKNSYNVLNELYDFLDENEDVVVEIGGHTNNQPTVAYCDKLSTQRAKAVATYLIRKGIEPRRVQFKGYGKRNPIASNDTKNGRQRNQRVEIKILSMNG